MTSHAEEGPLSCRVWHNRGLVPSGLIHWSECSSQDSHAPPGHWKISVHLAVLIAFGLLLPPLENSLMYQLDAKDAPIRCGVLAVTAQTAHLSSLLDDSCTGRSEVRYNCPKPHLAVSPSVLSMAALFLWENEYQPFGESKKTAGEFYL